MSSRTPTPPSRASASGHRGSRPRPRPRWRRASMRSPPASRRLQRASKPPRLPSNGAARRVRPLSALGPMSSVRELSLPWPWSRHMAPTCVSRPQRTKCGQRSRRLRSLLPPRARQGLPMTLLEAKKAARAAAVRRRDAAHAALAATAPQRVAANFTAAFPLADAAVVSGYWPGRSELDIRPLMKALHERGNALGLPVVSARARPLVFRRWRPGDALEAKPFGLSEPFAEAGELTPDVLLVPFLAFDREGYRIGYGAGYFDMTLAALRARGA